MSRPWKIGTPPPVTKAVVADDEVITKVTMPPILPPRHMGQLLGKVLKEKGFKDSPDGGLSRDEGGGVTTSIDPETGVVKVRAEGSEDVKEDGGDAGGCVCAARARELAREANRDAAAKGLQARVMGKLQKALVSLGCELEGATSQATSRALVIKAQSLGEVKRITHDNDTGGVTIVVEV